MAAGDTPIRLWDDNPSLTDLLGFGVVVGPVISAIKSHDIDPLTIGIHSPWGGGKSTVLNLIGDALDEEPYVVVRTDPWRYDNHDDVRGTLIAEVLDVLLKKFSNDSALDKKVKDLLKRISWGRVGLALGKGAITMQWKPDELIDAFTPKSRSDQQSMSGFEAEFETLVESLPGVERVVVLVDDLDRCLPVAVMATMEAIKLFLSVKKMVFVLAADQDMVRDAIAASLEATNRSEHFAQRYLEKIVQLPVSLPRLSATEAEAYIGLLVARSEAPSTQAFDALVEHCETRRKENKHTLLSEMDDLPWSPEQGLLQLAAQLAEGLSGDSRANPRQIKRFLNAFGVRTRIVEARGVDLEPAVLIKMLLLEDQHRASFQTLAGTDGDAERRSLVEEWEKWGRAESDAQPEGVGEETKHWAGSKPSLATVNLGSYLDLAASLIHVRFGDHVSDAVVSIVDELISESAAGRAAAIERVVALSDAEQGEALALLLRNGRRLEDLDVLFESIIQWGVHNPDIVDRVGKGIRDLWVRLTPGSVVNLNSSGIPAFKALLADIRNDTSLEPMVREAASMEGD